MYVNVTYKLTVGNTDKQHNRNNTTLCIVRETCIARYKRSHVIVSLIRRRVQIPLNN